MTRTGRIVTTLGAAVAGATAGYIAGVFSAPASGRDTRRRLGRQMEHKTDDLARKAEHTLKEARQRLSDVLYS